MKRVKPPSFIELRFLWLLICVGIEDEIAIRTAGCSAPYIPERARSPILLPRPDNPPIKLMKPGEGCLDNARERLKNTAISSVQGERAFPAMHVPEHRAQRPSRRLWKSAVFTPWASHRCAPSALNVAGGDGQCFPGSRFLVCAHDSHVHHSGLLLSSLVRFHRRRDLSRA